MFIKNHGRSYLVELNDGSHWRIWPADLALTLGWSPNTQVEVLPIEDDFCTHILVNRSDGSRVRVAKASTCWSAGEVGHSLQHG
jgi:hypothetical protein